MLVVDRKDPEDKNHLLIDEETKHLTTVLSTNASAS